jgi:hypothetical protein
VSMRTTILISAALIAVWLAYAASPFFAVYDLLRLVQERNLAELPARIDFSGGAQIAHGAVSENVSQDYREDWTERIHC